MHVRAAGADLLTRASPGLTKRLDPVDRKPSEPAALPCGGEGHGPHRYQFTLFAVRQDALQVTADTSAAIIGFQLHFNTIEKVTLTGLFKR